MPDVSHDAYAMARRAAVRERRITMVSLLLIAVVAIGSLAAAFLTGSS